MAMSVDVSVTSNSQRKPALKKKEDLMKDVIVLHYGTFGLKCLGN